MLFAMSPASQARKNPFSFGDVATGEHFTNREREIASLARDLRGGQNVLILSPRRFGKTSLITAALAQLRQEGILVAYLDLLRTTTRERFAGQLATALFDGLVPPVERLLQRAGELFRDLPLRPRLTINPDGTPSFEFGTATDGPNLDETIDRLLALPHLVTEQRKRNAVLVLDELQEIVNIAPDLLARMRATFQFQPRVAHVYLGSRQHLLRQVFTDVNAPLYNSARVLPLGPIAAESFTPFIRRRFADSGLPIDDSAITRLLEITGGHPHDTQKLCSFTWAAADAASTPPTVDTVDSAVTEILATDTARYVAIWDALTPGQRRMLEALARADAPRQILSDSERRAYRLGTYASAKRALESLISRGLVERSGRDTIEIPDVFLRLWLRQDSSPLPSA